MAERESLWDISHSIRVKDHGYDESMAARSHRKEILIGMKFNFEYHT